MSDDRGPPGEASQTPPPPRRRRDRVTTVLMVIGGIILLLPGVCSVVFIGAMGRDAGPLALLWAICFAISAGGVVMLVKAAR